MRAIALLTVALLVAVVGLALATLVPRDADDSGGPMPVLVVTQTIPGPTDNDLVGRSSVTTAFARVGEPLTVRLDMAQADPGSPADVIYVPEAEDVPEPPFELDLFEEVRNAREHARLVRSVAGPDAEVEQWKNVLLVFSSSVSDERRERIIGALRSL